MCEVVELTSELIRIPSVNPPGGEQPAVDLLDARLTILGLETVRVGVPGHGDTLLARLPGADPAAPARIFTGHTDVVGVSDAERARWASDPFEPAVRDGRLSGRGSTDMKGGLAAFVTAASELVTTKRTPPADVLLVITSDEEDTMTGSKAVADHPWLAREADVVVCEPTMMLPRTVGKGRTWAHVTCHGASGHGSGAGASGLDLALDLLALAAREDFGNRADVELGASFWRPLAIHAGQEPCVVPDVCTFTLDARLVPDHEPDDVWRRLDRLIARLREQVGGAITYEVIDRREGWRTPPSATLVTQCVDAVAATGLPLPQPLPRDAAFAGTTDGTVLRRSGTGHGTRDTVILGPGDLTLAHHENESVSIAELDAAVAVYTRLMLRANS